MEKGNYEYEERAAIREFDGGHDRRTAECLADQDMRARQAERDRVEALGTGSYIEELEAERKCVKETWLAATDEKTNQRLKRRWQELSMKIVRLKKDTGD